MGKHEPKWHEEFRDEVAGTIEYRCLKCQRTVTVQIDLREMPSLAEH